MANKSQKVPEEPLGHPAPSLTSSPSGVDQLRTLARVDILQDIVKTEQGAVIFRVKKSKSFYDMYDETGTAGIRLNLLSACLSVRMAVLIDGQSVAELQSSVFLRCTPKYEISDARGKKMLKIVTPGFGETRFLMQVQDMKGKQIGGVTKVWKGQADDLLGVFSKSKELQIDFPIDLDVQYKAAVIGFCIITLLKSTI